MVEKLAVLFETDKEVIERYLQMLQEHDRSVSISLDRAVGFIDEKMNERKKYLQMQKEVHEKWQGKNGAFYTYFPDDTKPKHRALCKRGTERELDDAIVEYWKTQEKNPTIEEVFTEWNDRRLGRGQIKKATHTRNIEIFNRFYTDFKKRRISYVQDSDWEDFLCDAIVEYQLTAKAFSNLKGITKGFLKRAKKRNLLKMNVESFFQELDVSDHDFKRRVINDEDEVFTDDEIAKIMKYIRSNLDAKNLGIALMFVTGIRVGELVTLKYEDFEGTMFYVKRTETRYRKTSNSYEYGVDEFPKTPAGYRPVFIPTDQKWIIEKLRMLNPFGSFVFIDSKGERLNTDKVRRRLTYICEKVGIPPRSPHKIRKTYGSILLDNNMDRKLIEGQMGHTSIQCTEQFYHRNRRKKDEKQAAFDALPEFRAV